MPIRSARNKRILALIGKGVVFARDIGEAIGATRPQAYQALLELEERGYIRRAGRKLNPFGPPSIRWRLNVGNEQASPIFSPNVANVQ